jgi:hypothetical protein
MGTSSTCYCCIHLKIAQQNRKPFQRSENRENMWRQKRSSKGDLAMGLSEANGADCDDHSEIPRDSNGLPIYFILPPGVLASYKRRLSYCERGWAATGDPAFVAEALIWTFLHRQPMTLWLAEAAVTLVLARRTKMQANRTLARRVQWMRFDAVRIAKEDGLRWLETRIEDATKLIADLRKKGADAERIEDVKQTLKDAERRAEKIRKRGWVTWEEAHQLAVEALRGTRAKAKAGTMDADYKHVKHELVAGRGALYFLPKVPRKSLAEVLDAPIPPDRGL